MTTGAKKYIQTLDRADFCLRDCAKAAIDLDGENALEIVKAILDIRKQLQSLNTGDYQERNYMDGEWR